MPSLALLEKAGIVSKITHSSGQGIPLAAAAKPETFKANFLDIALSQAILGVDSGSWLLEPEINFINKGKIKEAFVGQELLANSMSDRKSDLFYRKVARLIKTIFRAYLLNPSTSDKIVVMRRKNYDIAPSTT